jgi:NDP-sugar pyrophosphorylase family protein
MPLGETPILEIVLRQLAIHGFSHVTLAVGHLAELMEAFFGDGSKFGLQVDYSREESPLGTAGPLGLLTDLTEPFLVMNGDVLTTLDYGAFLAEHVESGAVASVATKKRSTRIDFGIVQTDASGDITGYIEKPEHEYRVSMGVYAFSPKALKYIERGEQLDFPDLILRLLAADERVRSIAFEGYWLDIGRHDDFARAQGEFEAMRSQFLPQGS